VRKIICEGVCFIQSLQGFSQAKVNGKEVAGKLMGDAKLKTEGKAEKIEGKIQNAIGGLKDVAKK
jgi:uncharacterized protein YjbJ (UPF0337 family)